MLNFWIKAQGSKFGFVFRGWPLMRKNAPSDPFVVIHFGIHCRQKNNSMKETQINIVTSFQTSTSSSLLLIFLYSKTLPQRPFGFSLRLPHPFFIFLFLLVLFLYCFSLFSFLFFFFFFFFVFRFSFFSLFFDFF